LIATKAYALCLRRGSIEHLPSASHTCCVPFDSDQILAGNSGVELILLSSEPVSQICIDEKLNPANTPSPLTGDRGLVDSSDERLQLSVTSAGCRPFGLSIISNDLGTSVYTGQPPGSLSSHHAALLDVVFRSNAGTATAGAPAA
jgi:hypothetical protein